MKTRGWQIICFLPLVLCAVSFVDAQMAPTGETALVTGATWQQLNPNEKVAFVWGVGHLRPSNGNTQGERARRTALAPGSPTV